MKILLNLYLREYPADEILLYNNTSLNPDINFTNLQIGDEVELSALYRLHWDNEPFNRGKFTLIELRTDSVRKNEPLAVLKKGKYRTIHVSHTWINKAKKL